VAKYVLKKKETREQTYLQAVETEHTAQQLLEIADNNYEDVENSWEPQYDCVTFEDYEVLPYDEAKEKWHVPDDLEAYELETIDDFLDDEEEVVLADDGPKAEARNCFLRILKQVLSEIKDPYDQQGELAEQFWVAGLKYADSFLTKYSEAFPGGYEEAQVMQLAGALKDCWDSIGLLHSTKANEDDEEEEVGVERFISYLYEIKELSEIFERYGTDVSPST
jgi:hypothetical protein